METIHARSRTRTACPSEETRCDAIRTSSKVHAQRRHGRHHALATEPQCCSVPTRVARLSSPICEIEHNLMTSTVVIALFPPPRWRHRRSCFQTASIPHAGGFIVAVAIDSVEGSSSTQGLRQPMYFQLDQRTPACSSASSASCASSRTSRARSRFLTPPSRPSWGSWRPGVGGAPSCSPSSSRPLVPILSRRASRAPRASSLGPSAPPSLLIVRAALHDDCVGVEPEEARCGARSGLSGGRATREPEDAASGTKGGRPRDAYDAVCCACCVKSR